MLYVIAVVVFALDQWLKWEVTHHLVLTELVPVMPPAVYWDYIRNPGGAFGILPEAQWVLVLVALVVIGGVVFIDRKFRPTLWTKIAMGVLLGGALGNLSDRVFSGTVVDFVYLKVINFPVFNLADVAIDTGVIMLLLKTFISDKRTRDSQSSKDVENR